MSVIKIPDNKNIEYKELEVHVVMCEYRRRAMEEHIKRVEERLDQFENQSKLNKKLMFGSALSIITAVITTVLSFYINYKLLSS